LSVIGRLIDRGQIADPITLKQYFEDTAVHPVGEMLGPQEVGDALIGAVVVQDGAEQRHLGFVVVRRRAVEPGRGGGVGRADWANRGHGIHGATNLAERVGRCLSHHHANCGDNGGNSVTILDGRARPSVARRSGRAWAKPPS